MGAHLVPADTKVTYPLNPDPLLGSVQVADHGGDQHARRAEPHVAFTVKDLNGNPLAVSSLATLSFTMAGPTSDYGYTSFGSDVTTPGYVTRKRHCKATCDSSGNCTYTFQSRHSGQSHRQLRHGRGSGARRRPSLPGTTSQMTRRNRNPEPSGIFLGGRIRRRSRAARWWPRLTAITATPICRCTACCGTIRSIACSAITRATPMLPRAPAAWCHPTGPSRRKASTWR